MNQIDNSKSLVSLGLMSGTSLDGVDAAIIETDGVSVIDVGPYSTSPYPDEFRNRLADEVREAGEKERPTTDESLVYDLTKLHVEAARTLIDQATPGTKWSSPDVIGFHGHTTLHRPDRRYTQQIGNPGFLADELRISVVSDFRVSDVAAGGQGAPLAPAFHAAMVEDLPKPLAVLNVGGMANVSWFSDDGETLIAFDTGPGNGLLDMWIEKQTGERFDKDGKHASAGRHDLNRLEVLMSDPYFEQPWPKSVDRSDFGIDAFEDLSLCDGAATITEFTVQSIALGLEQCPKPPATILVTGGGRHNQYMMDRLSKVVSGHIQTVEDIGWNGDSVEAQAFAYLAVRSLKGLPITFPGTTGVEKAMTGGELTRV